MWWFVNELFYRSRDPEFVFYSGLEYEMNAYKWVIMTDNGKTDVTSSVDVTTIVIDYIANQIDTTIP